MLNFQFYYHTILIFTAVFNLMHAYMAKLSANCIAATFE